MKKTVAGLLLLAVLVSSSFAEGFNANEQTKALEQKINKTLAARAVPYVNASLIKNIFEGSIYKQYPEASNLNVPELLVLALIPRFSNGGALAESEIKVLVNNIESFPQNPNTASAYKYEAQQQLAKANYFVPNSDLSSLINLGKTINKEPFLFQKDAATVVYSSSIIKVFGIKSALTAFYSSFTPYLKKAGRFPDKTQNILLSSVEVSQHDKQMLDMLMKFTNDYPVAK